MNLCLTTAGLTLIFPESGRSDTPFFREEEVV